MLSLTLRTSINKIIYMGKRYYCPCCEHGYRAFKSMGNPTRRNVLCPGCNSLERHRFLSIFLKKQLDLLKRSQLLLHVAPESCLKKTLQLGHQRVIQTDKFSKVNGIRSDLTCLPFRENTFNAIICNHVLEHIDNDNRALQEIYRVLKCGGWTILQVPLDNKRATTLDNPQYNTPELRQLHFGQDDHVRLYGLDFFDRVENAGFNVKKIVPRDLLNEIEIGRFRIDTDDCIPLGCKSTEKKF